MAAQLKTRDVRSISLQVDGKLVCKVEMYTSAALSTLADRRAHAESVVLEFEAALVSKGKPRVVGRLDIKPRVLVPIRKIIEAVYALPLEDGEGIDPLLVVTEGESPRHRLLTLTAKQGCRGRAKTKSSSTTGNKLKVCWY